MTVINEELTANSRQLEEEIERRKESELELRDTNQKTTNILESISDAFLALDHKWRYTYLNSEAKRQMGIQDASELIGKVIWEVFPNSTKLAYEKYHQAVLEQTPVRFEAYSQVTRRWHDIHAYPFYNSSGRWVYVNDIGADLAGGPKEILMAQNINDRESWKRNGLLDVARQVLETGFVANKQV
jgi:PAS domain S-box-containing protein